jgi:uncharacterized membrane protein (UPF0127 family)
VTRVVSLQRGGGGIACERCRIADRPLSRMRGLLGRRRLESGEGLLLRPAPSVHTFFMRFPIDAVFLDREGTVVKVRANVRPWRLAGCRGAHATLELPAGEAELRAIRESDRLEPIGAEANGNG